MRTHHQLTERGTFRASLVNDRAVPDECPGACCDCDCGRLMRACEGALAEDCEPAGDVLNPVPLIVPCDFDGEDGDVYYYPPAGRCYTLIPGFYSIACQDQPGYEGTIPPASTDIRDDPELVALLELQDGCDSPVCDPAKYVIGEPCGGQSGAPFVWACLGVLPPYCIVDRIDGFCYTFDPDTAQENRPNGGRQVTPSASSFDCCQCLPECAIRTTDCDDGASDPGCPELSCIGCEQDCCCEGTYEWVLESLSESYVQRRFRLDSIGEPGFVLEQSWTKVGDLIVTTDVIRIGQDPPFDRNPSDFGVPAPATGCTYCGGSYGPRYISDGRVVAACGYTPSSSRKIISCNRVSVSGTYYEFEQAQVSQGSAFAAAEMRTASWLRVYRKVQTGSGNANCNGGCGGEPPAAPPPDVDTFSAPGAQPVPGPGFASGFANLVTMGDVLL